MDLLGIGLDRAWLGLGSCLDQFGLTWLISARLGSVLARLGSAWLVLRLGCGSVAQGPPAMAANASEVGGSDKLMK